MGFDINKKNEKGILNDKSIRVYFAYKSHSRYSLIYRFGHLFKSIFTLIKNTNFNFYNFNTIFNYFS